MQRDEHKVRTLTFKVDSALLEELGKRLVGSPGSGLAELVKNSYDADATEVSISLDPDNDLIVIEDNGHGMTLDEFETHWMSVGTKHKVEQSTSRKYGRSLTGSKGVGRLAAQILANRIEVWSVAECDPSMGFAAKLDWSDARKKKELTEVEVTCEEITSPDQSVGTKIVLSKLENDWSNEKNVKELARQIWRLQPPFPSLAKQTDDSTFRISFQSSFPSLEESFQTQLRIMLRLWEVKAVGEVQDGKLTLLLQFRDGHNSTEEFSINKQLLSSASYEIRFYELRGRQPAGIKVTDARDYLKKYGGVQIYDGGFRLPYYGDSANDWLRLGHDRARRLSDSRLLPDYLKVPEGLEHLPHSEHLLGAVMIDTSKETSLGISITRDRLISTKQAAIDELRNAVRIAVDWYAMEKMKRQLRHIDDITPIERAYDKLESAKQIVNEFGKTLPGVARNRLLRLITDTRNEVSEQESLSSKRMAVLGTLATAGITAVAHQHELSKQLSSLESVLEEIDCFQSMDANDPEKLYSIADRLRKWLQSARGIQRLFSHILQEEERVEERKFPARDVLSDVEAQLTRPLMGVEVVNDVSSTVLLPRGTYAEWISVFQNIFYNAANALIQCEKKVIRAFNRESNGITELVIEDTGLGVDLSSSEELFEPFVRKIPTTPANESLGYGGTGMGLPIIKMISKSKAVQCSFIRPSKGFSTAFSLRWEGE